MNRRKWDKIFASVHLAMIETSPCDYLLIQQNDIFNLESLETTYT